jgi:hypothetical protein
MKKRKIAAVFAAAVLAGTFTACGSSGSSDVVINVNNGSSETVKASGTSSEKETEIPDGVYKFTSESLSYSNGTIKIVIDPSADSSKVVCDDNIIDDISLEVSGSTVTLSGNESVMYDGINCTVTIGAAVNEVEVNGAVDVDYTVADDVTEVKVSESGACSVAVKGECDSAEFEVSGSSTIDSVSLKAADVAVTATGASNAGVYAENSIDANASGASAITYSGSPQTVNQSASGTATVAAK